MAEQRGCLWGYIVEQPLKALECRNLAGGVTSGEDGALSNGKGNGISHLPEGKRKEEKRGFNGKKEEEKKQAASLLAISVFVKEAKNS